MNRRAFQVGKLGCLLACLLGFQLKAADAPPAPNANPATIYFSSAPWDGAAYDLEIPLEPLDDAAKPYLRISIWGYPEFPGPKTIHFTGMEDSGGGPTKGEGTALFQPILNKSMPERLEGTVSFRILKRDSVVSGSYELASMDGRRVLKGSFEARWGNKIQAAIR